MMVVPSASSSVNFVVIFLLFQAAMCRSSPVPKMPLIRPEHATRPTWPACNGVSGLPPITVGSGARIRAACRDAGELGIASSNSSSGRPLNVSVAGPVGGTGYGSLAEFRQLSQMLVFAPKRGEEETTLADLAIAKLVTLAARAPHADNDDLAVANGLRVAQAKDPAYA